MEQAIFISKAENLKYVNSKYTRLYFGNEFCQRLIPCLEDVRIAIDFVLGHNMQFSLVTPFVTDKGIEILRPLLGYVSRNLSSAEIVVNDWGLFRLLKNEFGGLNPVLGRLLTKQKRGPRILKLKKMVPETMVEHFKESNIDVPSLSDFLINNGVNRIDLDNLLQGIARENPSLKASLYFPYAYVTTTRFCLAAISEQRTNFLRSISNCSKECQRYAFRLSHKNMPVDLFLKGNTQFFRNESLPHNLEDLNIDRIVYEPEIPV
jgi:hypothetical protein